MFLLLLLLIHYSLHFLDIRKHLQSFIIQTQNNCSSMSEAETILPRPCSSLTSIESIVFGFTSFNRAQLNQYKTYLEEHINYDTNRIQRAIRCNEQINRLLERLTSSPQSITDLINQMDEINETQAYTLRNLCQRNENNQIYMTNYEKNTSTASRSANVEGTFTILGSVRKGKRENYDVKLFKPNTNEKGSFWCNCPDHKFNSKKKDIVCKHICFIVCKVAKILDIDYFQTKQLSPEQFETITSKADNLHELLKDTTICRLPSNITKELFTQRTRPLTEDDVCPICYEALSLTDADDMQALSCPSCLNYVHKECMNVWLERKSTCVYCRSEVWSAYKEIANDA